MQLKVAAAQMAVTDDIEMNLSTILRAVAFAAAEGADILLTPEGSLSGYTPHFNRERLESALQTLTAEAKEAGIGLALGTIMVEPDDGRCYNELRFYARNGTYLGAHAKILLCSTLTEPYQGELNDFATRPLRTFQFNEITVGGLICNDMWANPVCTTMPDPHLTQQLAGMGARVIFHAINGGRNASEKTRVGWHYHEANVLMRAAAGSVWIVTVDNSDPATMPCSEQSGVAGPDGYWAYRARPQGEHFFSYTIEL